MADDFVHLVGPNHDKEDGKAIQGPCNWLVVSAVCSFVDPVLDGSYVAHSIQRG